MNLKLLEEIQICSVCSKTLPLGPRPLLAASRRSRILLIGQAPGRVAHEAGTPWKDRSGDRLREWLGVDSSAFYDPDRVAIMPMGFCYPGTGKRGDLAPRPECAPLWHDRLISKMPAINLRVYIGQYPLNRYFPNRFDSLTTAVRAFGQLLPESIVLPHPSPRNAMWVAKNPWFLKEAVPRLREVVRRALS
jgi:uracil-DNA glycosylase